MPLARNEALWRRTGRRVFFWCVLAFAVLGLLAGIAVARTGIPLALAGLQFAGWGSVAAVTILMTAAGGLFGAVWLLIFNALAEASRK